MSPVELASARVLLTGATGGLGHAVARELASRGADLVLTGRRADALCALAAELDAAVIPADLSNPEDVSRLLGQAGPVDVLIANAGLPAGGHILDFSAADLDRVLDVNLRAPMLLARALAEQMTTRRAGHIVFMGSVAGLLPAPRVSLYNATKFGLRGFALALRHDLRDAGIGVSIVEPGFVRDAGMFADSGSRVPPGMRTTTPQQVSHAVIRAIRDDIDEIVVAPIETRLLATIGCIAPALVAPIHHLIDSERLGTELGSRFHHEP
ncbi:SDR family NAD(P)-dependent oxidoreductase [Nocardia abscessus]|uniref:SDR family NAD(P)-dependent oxidoreductase n=1 Tax=Nocardia abscessus TaxID=120957 RepID=UPI0018949A48|nr:SDR family NAD(P)-dependent oxidoreductase [Nocardia abscessus]MBF6341690.1 SDR family NAD(P)-dependent oxidoreductase [Nocardia abscessus]